MEATTCGHVYCRSCLEKWRQSHDTCPVCRSSIAPTPAWPPTVTPQPAVPTPARQPAVAPTRTRQVRSPVRSRPTTSDYANREHEERLSRRQRQLALERRLDSYRSSMWTPSGRPYEDLPVVSLGEMRKAIKQNVVGLAMNARMDSGWARVP